jgi:hypothetical protein
MFDWDFMGKQGSMTSLHNMVTIYTPKEDEFKCNFNDLKISKAWNCQRLELSTGELVVYKIALAVL